METRTKDFDTVKIGARLVTAYQRCRVTRGSAFVHQSRG
jgi:hypothetical protein